MKNLSNDDKKLIKKLISGEISDLTKYQESIDELKKKLSYKDYKEIFQQIPEIKLENAVIKEVIEEDLVATIQHLTKMGKYFKINKDFNHSKDLYEKALTLNEKVNDIHFKCYLLMKLGKVYQCLKNYPDALSRFYEALDIADANLKVKIHNKIGLVYYEQKEYRKALKKFEFALEMGEELRDLTEKANVLNNIGIILYDQGNFEKALTTFDEALTVTIQLKDLSEEAIVLNNIGNIYHVQGKFNEALKKFEEALTIDDKLGHLKCKPQRLISIGNIYQNQKRTDKALKTFTDALICFSKENEIPISLVWGEYSEAEPIIEIKKKKVVSAIKKIYLKKFSELLEVNEDLEFLSDNDMIEKFPKISIKDRSNLNQIFKTKLFLSKDDFMLKY